jgi:hypothetical protein
LIRVYREQVQQVNQSGTDEKLLSQLKWPIEYMMTGLRPVWNTKLISSGVSGLVTVGNQNMWRDWHRLTYNVNAVCDEPTLAEVPAIAVTTTTTVTNTVGQGPPVTVTSVAASTSTVAAGTATAIAAFGSSIGAVIPDQYWLPVPTVDSLSLTSHGITIYDNFADLFYSSYAPFHYGGPALVTPNDVGALFVNMALFPRSYQPSGHLNISRARETYLKWSTSYISSASPAQLVCVAVAINFLLITDGSAVLRYST